MLKKIMLLLIGLLPIFAAAQNNSGITVSGKIKEFRNIAVPYANITFSAAKDSSFVTGTVTDDQGRFSLSGLKSGNYILQISAVGYKTWKKSFIVGTLSTFLDMGY